MGDKVDQIDEITDKIAYLLSSVVKNPGMPNLQKLAVLTKIRQELSTEEVTPDISKIFASTDILAVINEILSLKSQE